MRICPSDDSNVKTADRSVDHTETSRLGDTDNATRLAQLEFGRFYARPEYESFVDRSPEALRQLRAKAWLGISR